MGQSATIHVAVPGCAGSTVQITMEDTLAKCRANLRIEEAKIAAHSSAQCGRKRWKTKEGVYQLKHPEQCEQAAPTADDAIFADMLRDV